MAKLKEFILTNFLKSFLTLFLPFFIIISLTYLIKISNISSKVNLEFLDFAKMFMYVLPHIIFATLPLTFIGATINTFAKLSEDNEITAIFSLGYSPAKIYRYLLPLAFLFTLFLSALTLYILPYADQHMDNFKSKKVYDAKLKVLPKKLSQNFGKQHIFIESNENNRFKNVTMFSEDKDGYMQIMLSKSGSIEHKADNKSYLSLDNGSLYRYKDKNFQIIDFSNLKIYNNKKFYTHKVLSPIKFWKKYLKKFYYFLLISLSPLLLLALLITLGIYNPRYQKNRASIYILFSSLLVYIPAILAKEKVSIYVTISIMLVWIVTSIVLFKQKLSKRY